MAVKKIKYYVLKGMMGYSLLIGFVFGFVLILLDLFKDLFLPIFIFSVLLGALHSVFSIYTKDEEYRFFISMAITLVFVNSFLGFVQSIAVYINLSPELFKYIFRVFSQSMGLLVMIFVVPVSKGIVRLVFLNTGDNPLSNHPIFRKNKKASHKEEHNAEE